MNLDKKQYKRYATAHAPRSPLIRDCLRAFFVGGIICALGQLFCNLYKKIPSIDEESASLLCSVTLIFLAVLLTALGVFDKIAKLAGAGTLVPITGFANAVVSPAIDFKSENWCNGVGAKMFTIAGPVIVYGVTASVIYGIILVLLQSF